MRLRQATLHPQVSASPDRPLLSVGDHWVPVLRARGGHGRQWRRWSDV